MRDELNLHSNWKIMVLAFLVWAAHFMIAYGAELIMPGNPAVRWIALGAALAACALLAQGWRRVGSDGSPVVRLALAIAALAIAFQTLPALIG